MATYTTYSAESFLAALANKTKTPALMIQTDGTGANSLRYLAIQAEQSVIEELRENDIAFLTFTDIDDAVEVYEAIADNFPAQTPLSLNMTLAIPGRQVARFMSTPGVKRYYERAS